MTLPKLGKLEGELDGNAICTALLVAHAHVLSGYGKLDVWSLVARQRAPALTQNTHDSDIVAGLAPID